MKRQQTWEVFVCGWAYEFLNYVSKVILVDIVDWWLMLLCLLLLNLWLWLSVIGIKVLIWGLSLIVIKRVFFIYYYYYFIFYFFMMGLEILWESLLRCLLVEGVSWALPQSSRGFWAFFHIIFVETNSIQWLNWVGLG